MATGCRTGLCPVCGKGDAELEKTLGDGAKPPLVCVAGSWLVAALCRAGFGLGSGTAFRYCKACSNLYENHVRGKVTEDHSLLRKTYPRTKHKDVSLLSSVLEHDGKTLVSASAAACAASFIRLRPRARFTYPRGSRFLAWLCPHAAGNHDY